MANIIDYLKKYGDQTFDEFAFNDVDGLILAQLTYQGFDSLAPKYNESKKYREEFKLIKDYVDNPDDFNTLIKNTLAIPNNRSFLKTLVNSRRYKDISINYFADSFDYDKVCQFAAMVFKLNEDIYFVAFRGTDITILGWKEDFNMGLYDQIPSQVLALEYLENVLPLLNKHKTIFVGGHSKGGNLSRYSSIHCNPHLQKRIDAVYDYDGPGMQTDTSDLKGYLKIKDRIHKLTPGDALIGILLKYDSNFKVVKSKSVSIFQHDPFNWFVDLKTGDFEYLEKTGFISRVNELALNRWIDNLTIEERCDVINVLFKVIDKAGIKTVPQMSTYPITSFYRSIMSFAGLTKKERYLATRAVAELASAWVKCVKIQTPKKSLKERVKKVKQKITKKGAED